MKFLAPAIAVLAAAPVLLPPSASAQTAPAQAAQPAQPAVQVEGPAIPGICLFSREAMFANAAVGKSASQQVQKMGTDAQAEFDRERTPLEDALRNLEGQRNTLGAEQYAQQRQTLGQRWEDLQQKAAHRSRELEVTQRKAVDRVFQEAQPVVAAVYNERKCGLLLDRNVVLGGNMSGDLTEAVVRGLDAKIQTFPVQREVLPTTPAQANP